MHFHKLTNQEAGSGIRIMYLLKGAEASDVVLQPGSRLSRQMISSDSGRRVPTSWPGSARELCQKWKNDTRWVANISLVRAANRSMDIKL